MKAVVLALLLTGCAGQASYQVRPFYSPDLKQMVCCEAIVTSSRNIQSVQVDAVKTGTDYQIHFTETGVNASAPIAAQSQSISAVAGAVSNTTAAVVKLAP
jgi:hypothetical protein